MKLLRQKRDHVGGTVRGGFSGTREGITVRQLNAVRELMLSSHMTELHHGDCEGADKQAHELAVSLYFDDIYIHPPLDDKYRAYCDRLDNDDTGVHVLPPLDYLHRNYCIVAKCPRILIIAPKEAEETRRSGSWATMRYARKRSVTHRYIVEPSGKVREDS